MTCSICGREERAEANFCSNCGRAMAWRTNPAAAPPYAQAYGLPLTRPHHGRMVAGVCAGLAQHYGWDVSLVRIVTLLSILLAGAPVAAYLVAWMCIPNAPYLLPAGYPAAPQATGTMGQ